MTINIDEHLQERLITYGQKWRELCRMLGLDPINTGPKNIIDMISEGTQIVCPNCGETHLVTDCPYPPQGILER